MVMNSRIVTIYQRKDGRIYLHPHDWTSVGMSLGCPPFIKIEPGEAHKLPGTVRDLLQIEPKIVPHPQVFDWPEPVYEIAGCRSWRAFVAGTLCFHVVSEQGTTELIRTKKDGAGFAHLPDRVPLDEAGGLEALPSLLSEWREFPP